MNSVKNLLVAGAVCAAAFASSAQATIILVDASGIQGENVLFNQGNQSGTTVSGFTNQSNAQVDFSSTSVLRASGGQAEITGDLNLATNNPNDTLNFSNLSFGLESGDLFNNAEFNLFGGNATGVSFAVIDNDGQVFNFNNLSLGNGQNFFGFQGIDGESIASISFTTIGGTGIQSVRQVRLDLVDSGGGGIPGGVPEPSTWGLMIIGFGMVGYSARRRKRAVSVLA